MNRSHLAAGALALAIAGLVAGTTVAVAQGTAPSRSKIDANGDGAIDRAEAAAHPRMAEKFDQPEVLMLEGAGHHLVNEAPAYRERYFGFLRERLD